MRFCTVSAAKVAQERHRHPGRNTTAGCSIAFMARTGRPPKATETAFRASVARHTRTLKPGYFRLDQIYTDVPAVCSELGISRATYYRLAATFETAARAAVS